MLDKKIGSMAVFPGTPLGSYVFRVSISNQTNIMIIAFCTTEPKDIIIRFFTDEELAGAFVRECSMGKHSP